MSRDTKGHHFVSFLHADAKDFFIWMYRCTECQEVISVKTPRKGKKSEEITLFEACPNPTRGGNDE